MPLCLGRDLGSVRSSLNRNGNGGELVIVLTPLKVHFSLGSPSLLLSMFMVSSWYNLCLIHIFSMVHNLTMVHSFSMAHNLTRLSSLSMGHSLTMVYSLIMVHRSHYRSQSQHGIQSHHGTQSHHGSQPQYDTQSHHGLQPQHGTQPHYGAQPQHALQSDHSLQPPMVYSPTVALWYTDLSWCTVSHDRQSPVIGGLTTEYSLTVVYSLSTYITSPWDSDSLTTGHSLTIGYRLTMIHSLTWYPVSQDLWPYHGIQLCRGLRPLSTHSLPMGHSLSIVHNLMEPPGFHTCSFLRIPHQSVSGSLLSILFTPQSFFIWKTRTFLWIKTCQFCFSVPSMDNLAVLLVVFLMWFFF